MTQRGRFLKGTIKTKANFAQASLALAGSGATAAASTGTAGFYANAGISRSHKKQSQSMFSQKWKGSFFNVGGDATFKVKDDFTLQGSNLQVTKKLTLDAKKINVLAGVEESRSSSNSEEHQAGASIGFSAPTNVSGNASTQNSDSSSHSTRHVLAGISAGTMESTSKAFTVKGGKVNVFGKADVTTDKLTVASVQDTSSNHNQSKGFNISGGTNGLGSVGGNASKGNGERKWTTEQSSFLVNTSGQAKDSGQIKAKHTHLEGGILASAQTDEYGRIVKDNGDLNLQTQTLTQTHVYDTDTQDQKGINLSVSASKSGTSTLGANHSGHNRKQTTFASLGGGNIQIGGKQQSDAELKKQGLNTDITQTQKITKNQQTGGLNASVTVDHRLASEQGRNSIREDVKKTGMFADAAIQVATTEKVGLLDFNKQLGKQHDTYEGIKAELNNNPELAQQLNDPNLSPEQKQKIFNRLANSVMKKMGYKNTNVKLVDTSEKGQSGGEVNGHYGEDKNAYINDKNNHSTKDSLTTLGHELAHAQDDQEGTFEPGSQDQNTYATNYGSDFAGYTGFINTTFNNQGLANSNNHQGNQNSSLLQKNNQAFSKLDKSKGDDYLTPKQQHQYAEEIRKCGNSHICQNKVGVYFESLDDKQEVDRRIAQAKQIVQGVKDTAQSISDGVSSLLNSPEETLEKAKKKLLNLSLESVSKGLNDMADQQHQNHVDRENAYIAGDSEKLGKAEGNITSEKLSGLSLPGFSATFKGVKEFLNKLKPNKTNDFSGNNGSSYVESEFDGKNPSDYLAEQKQLEQQKIHQQNLVEIYTPPKQKPTGAYTQDNKYKDIQFYENLEKIQDKVNIEVSPKTKKEKLIDSIRVTLEVMDNSGLLNKGKK